MNRFAKWYTPIVLLSCAGIAFIPLAVGASNTKGWVYLALQILVTACPCALVLSVPVTGRSHENLFACATQMEGELAVFLGKRLRNVS